MRKWGWIDLYCLIVVSAYVIWRARVFLDRFV